MSNTKSPVTLFVSQKGKIYCINTTNKHIMSVGRLQRGVVLPLFLSGIGQLNKQNEKWEQVK